MHCAALQDADHYWVLTPPAQQSLLRLLGGEEGIAIRWGLVAKKCGSRQL